MRGEGNQREILIGEGYLDWRSQERQTDRYGAVSLSKRRGIYRPDLGRLPGARLLEGIAELASVRKNSVDLSKAPVSSYGILIANILESHVPQHVGDLIRGIKPEPPLPGERLELGEGVLFLERDIYGQTIGVKPLDDRPNDWMDPQTLYKAHLQKVALIFEPRDEARITPPVLN